MKKNVLLIVLKLLMVFTPFTMLRSIEYSLGKGEINFSFCMYIVIAICCAFVFYKVVRADLEEDKRMWKPLKEATAFLFAAVSLFIYNKGIFTWFEDGQSGDKLAALLPLIFWLATYVGIKFLKKE